MNMHCLAVELTGWMSFVKPFEGYSHQTFSFNKTESKF